MIIKKKISPEWFEQVRSGQKNFEIRLADWVCKEGDTLVLCEWDPKTGKLTGRKIEKKVACVVDTKECNFWPKKDIQKYMFQVIGFR